MENIIYSVIGSIIGGACGGVIAGKILDWIRKPAKYKEIMKGMRDVRNGKIFSIEITIPEQSCKKYVIVKNRKVCVDNVCNLDDLKHKRRLIINKNGIEIIGKGATYSLLLEWDRLSLSRISKRFWGHYFVGEGKFPISCPYDHECDGEIVEDWNDKMKIGDEFKCPKCNRPSCLDITEKTVDCKKIKLYILNKTR